MKSNIKKHPQTKSFEEYAEKRFGKEQCDEWQKEAFHEAEIVRAMQKLIQSSVDEYMKKQEVGFNELVRRLDVSPTYVSKMRKGQANLTIATFAHLMATLGKKPSEFLKIKK